MDTKTSKTLLLFDLIRVGVVGCQDMGGSSAQLESQLMVRHVTADSFRTFTIVAENKVSTTLRAVRLLTRG